MSTANWNILVYAIAKSEQEVGDALRVVDDMRAKLQSSRCNAAVQLNSPTARTRFWISMADKMRQDIHPPVDTTRAASLTDFIDASRYTFPATSTALILLAHGSGLDQVHEDLSVLRAWPQV